jgi:putative lipoprotein (rSAM/lipoprotein system)
MKIIRNRFLTSYNVILTALMALLGFATSCERFGGTEYGVPHASFIVKGKIVSAEGNSPVPNIKVRMQIDSLSMQTDSAYSDSKGNYQVVDEFGFPISHSYSIKFTDIDGTANGEFQTLDTVVEFKDPVYKGGDGNWDSGETKKEFNIVLKPKK